MPELTVHPLPVTRERKSHWPLLIALIALGVIAVLVNTRRYLDDRGHISNLRSLHYLAQPGCPMPWRSHRYIPKACASRNYSIQSAYFTSKFGLTQCGPRSGIWYRVDHDALMLNCAGPGPFCRVNASQSFWFGPYRGQ